jgi:hypothetical protein
MPTSAFCGGNSQAGLHCRRRYHGQQLRSGQCERGAKLLNQWENFLWRFRNPWLIQLFADSDHPSSADLKTQTLELLHCNDQIGGVLP